MNREATPAPGESVATGVRAGQTLAIARAISLVEHGGSVADALLSALGPSTGRAWLIGITGPPGAGKSTLATRLIARYRARDLRVAVLAVDPSSAFSGGALLGDRVRMQAHALDAGVFIRSVATRGHLGGLSATTSDAVDVLDAAGFDIVLIETVGVGQDEVDIARLADTCVVVLVPGTGDDVQAMKAGVMEIADVFIVNKADLPGADRAAAAVRESLNLDDHGERPQPPVLPVVSTTGDGVDAVVLALEASRGEGDRIEARRRSRAERRLEDAIAREALASARRVAPAEAWDRLVDDIAARRADATRTAHRLAGRLGAGAIDHVGIATDDIEATLAMLGGLLHLPVDEPEDVGTEGVRVRFAGKDDARIEVIEAIDDSSAFARSVARRGPGLHHLALRVDDLAGTLARLEAAGVRLIDRTPRPGAHGTRVAFLHPSSARGLLIELVERSGSDAVSEGEPSGSPA